MAGKNKPPNFAAEQLEITPIERSETIPSDWYTGPAFHKWNRETVFSQYCQIIFKCNTSLPLTNHHSPITNHQSPITNHQSPITTHHSPITTHQSPITTHQSPITNHQSPITTHQSPLMT
jgi:hypothetical protein